MANIERTREIGSKVEILHKRWISDPEYRAAYEGALLLAVISNGLALNATGPFARQMLLGIVTIGAVVLDQFSRRRDS